MFFNTVHHVAIVSDYELSRDFYVDKLGLRLFGKITVQNVMIIS